MMRIALVALAAALAAPPDDDAAAPPDDDAAGVDWQRRRVVRVFASPFAGSSEAPAYAMTDALGRGYTCGLDGAAVAKRRGAGAAPSAAASAIEGYKAWRDSSRECAALALKEEYWHYELCPGRSARQFKPPKPRPRGGAAAPGASHALGAFSSAAGEASLAEVADVFGDVDSVTLPPAVDGAPPRTAHVELYERGDGGRRLLAYVVCGLVHVGAASSRRGSLDAYGDDDDADWADAVRVARVVEGPKFTYRALVASPLACAPRDLRTAVAAQAAAKLEGKCLRRRWRGDWWTYEVCVGDAVRQFRQPPGRDHDGFGVLAAADAAASRDPGGFASGSFSHVAVAPATGALSHVHAGGDACDATDGEPRDAAVRFACVDAFRGRSKKVALASAAETATCSYDIVVHLAALCELDDDADLHEKRAAGTSTIDHVDCFRDAEDEGGNLA